MINTRAALVFVLAATLLPTAGAAVDTLTLQAAQARIKTVGGVADGAWNLWSNGEWGDLVRFPRAAACRVRVVCRGTPAAGAWPEMAFCIDGRSRTNVTVSTREPREYVFAFDAEAADHRITVSFLNDALTDTEDRNLLILSMSIEADGAAPSLSPITEAAWRDRRCRELRLQEDRLLAGMAERIERNRKSDVTLRVTDGKGNPVPGAEISVALARHEFLFGCNIYKFDRFATAERNELYKERFRGLFNYATTGFYWRWYEHEKGKPEYAYTDKVVAWCMENRIRLKGHPLLWACEAGIPVWSGAQPSAEVQRQRVVDIMSRYSGKIAFWEVVNEPAHLSGLTLDEPYRWARAANPEATLIVNDYEVMANGFPPFFALLESAQKRGVPFDGIGIQAHEPRTLRFPLDPVWATLDRYATLGKPLHITEFTPASGGEAVTGPLGVGTWDEAAQADYAARFYTVCFAHPAVMAITWWDLCDDGAWLKGGGLLREDLSPKPAYEALRRLIHEQWTTRAAGKTDRGGGFSFRGFRGDYVARIGSGGAAVELPFHAAETHRAVTLVLPRN